VNGEIASDQKIVPQQRKSVIPIKNVFFKKKEGAPMHHHTTTYLELAY